MRRVLLIALVLFVALSAVAQKKKKEDKRELSDHVLAAQFIYVTGWHGNEFDFQTPADERSAIVRVQNAIRDWHRYQLVFHPDQADIMLVVKPSHLGMVQGGVNAGSGIPNIGVGVPAPGRTPSTGGGIGYGVEGGTPEDFLMLSL